jgi:hypothetical protein
MSVGRLRSLLRSRRPHEPDHGANLLGCHVAEVRREHQRCSGRGGGTGEREGLPVRYFGFVLHDGGTTQFITVNLPG